MTDSEFEQSIYPFLWLEYGDSYSAILNEVGEYQQEIFDSRADEGFIGNGYDWRSLAMVFLTERMPEIEDRITFDCESGMFSADSTDKEALQQFIIAFKTACENPTLIIDIFSRAELD